MALQQLLPFNEARFDACMAYLAEKHRRNLTTYDMVKLHVMIDVFHVGEHGKPVIGGAFSPWQFGPVHERAYKRLRAWEHQFEETGAEPPLFRFVGDDTLRFQPKIQVDADDFSKSELDAMEAAWKCVMSKNWADSQEFFHEPTTYMGHAWTNARHENRYLDWDEIIEGYERDEGLKHPSIKTLMRF